MAEEIRFDDITTGAANDLQRATETARRMVTQYGMSENLGLLTFGGMTRRSRLWAVITGWARNTGGDRPRHRRRASDA